MWLVVKLKKNYIPKIFKESLKKILVTDPDLYSPKISIQVIKGNKFYEKDQYILGNYMFVFHEKISENEFINKLSFVRGVDFVLRGFQYFQKDIDFFVNNCKKNEDKDGYLIQDYFLGTLNKKIKFHSGPFINFVSELINVQRNKISVLAGHYKILVNTKRKSIVSC